MTSVTKFSLNDDQVLNILFEDMNELDELNWDLEEFIDNECENEERQSDSDNSGEVIYTGEWNSECWQQIIYYTQKCCLRWVQYFLVNCLWVWTSFCGTTITIDEQVSAEW